MVYSFAAREYICRFFHAYPVAYKSDDKPQKNYPCKKYIVFSVIKIHSNTAESKENVRKLILKCLVNLPLKYKLETSVEVAVPRIWQAQVEGKIMYFLLFSSGKIFQLIGYFRFSSGSSKRSYVICKPVIN